MSNGEREERWWWCRVGQAGLAGVVWCCGANYHASHFHLGPSAGLAIETWAGGRGAHNVVSWGEQVMGVSRSNYWVEDGGK